MQYESLPIPPPPPTQALSSRTFKPPPLDGSLSFVELYDWHLINNPDHPLFVYSDAEGAQRPILWPEAVRAVHNAGRLVRRMTVRPGEETVTTPKVIAILAAAGKSKFQPSKFQD